MSCQISPSTLDTPYSRTPNVEISTHSILSTISVHLKANALSAGNDTLMAVLISTLFATLDENCSPDDPIYLMWTTATQTLALQKELRKKAGTTRVRMETLSREDWRDPAQMAIGHTRIAGLRSSMLAVSENFGTWLENWTQRHFAPNSQVYANMWNGSMHPSMRHTNPRPGSNLEGELFLSWLHGKREASLTEVSYSSWNGDPPPDGGEARSALPQLHPISALRGQKNLQATPRRRAYCRSELV